jgi:3-methyl-2-oxobutanoate hydroxymethyltransferase
MSKKNLVPDLIRMKKQGEKIIMLTAYDYTFAKLVDDSGANLILVGDSLGSVIQGKPNTLSVTLDEIIYHTKCVCAGASKALVVADLPFMSYQLGAKEGLISAGRILKETNAQAVKLEGGESVAETVKTIVSAGIPLMGHLGLTPQSFHSMGGHRVQGKEQKQAENIKRSAKILEDAGAFAIVLEGVPEELAKEVTESLSIPTIGIGAGRYCDGQVLVCYDLLGLTTFHEEDGKERLPKFLKRFAELKENVLTAFSCFCEEVRSGKFPTEQYSYGVAKKKPKLRMIANENN